MTSLLDERIFEHGHSSELFVLTNIICHWRSICQVYHAHMMTQQTFEVLTLSDRPSVILQVIFMPAKQLDSIFDLKAVYFERVQNSLDTDRDRKGYTVFGHCISFVAKENRTTSLGLIYGLRIFDIKWTSRVNNLSCVNWGCFGKFNVTVFNQACNIRINTSI